MKSFDAFRMIQYEKNQKSLGSRKSSVEHLVSPIFGDHDLGRNIGIISIEQLTLQLLQTLSHRRCQSLLIILPSEILNDSVNIYSDAFFAQFQQIEQYLLTNAFDFSIFFAFNDNEIIPQLLQTANDLFTKYGNTQPDIEYIQSTKQQLQPLTSPFALYHSYQLQGKEESTPIASIKYTNLFSTVKSSEQSEKYIVITANHDSYGIVPNLAFGVNDNGSGMTAVMSLINMFYKAYEKASSESEAVKAKYNLLFLLTAGGYSNYKGATKWMDDNKGGGTLLKSVDLVLCIDSIGRGEKLYIYTTEAAGSKAFEHVFRKVASEMKIDLVIKEKTLRTDTRLNEWHHEEYVRNDLNAITISSKAERYLTHNGTSILDNINRIDLDILYRNIQFISNVLSLITLNGNDSNVENKVSERYMNSYISYLNRVPRFGPYHHKSSYLRKLKTDLQSNSHETKIQQYTENEFIERFYTTDVVEIQAFEVRSYAFDLIFMLSNVFYLFIFYLTINRPKNFQEFRDLFASA